jgi:hypothetical protein
MLHQIRAMLNNQINKVRLSPVILKNLMASPWVYYGDAIRYWQRFLNLPQVMGSGTGQSIATCQLQNEPKNVRIGRELTEI